MGALKQKTEEEIAELKRQWSNDPCFDIEETEGFEAHKEELKIFAKEKQEEWNNLNKKRLQEKAIKLGIPDRVDLVKYLEELEYRIQRIEQYMRS